MDDDVRQRLAALARPRLTAGTVGVAVLCTVLGFATVVQVRSQDGGVLDRARRDELVQILDQVGERSTRLQEQVRELERTRDELASGVDRRAAALEEARERTRALSVLAGTVPVEGPGVVVRITDPRGRFGAAGLLATVQELRSADAEAVQVTGTAADASGTRAAVRVVVSTAFVGGDQAPGGPVAGVVVGGTPLLPPYELTAIGEPSALAGALRFPGGVVDRVTGPDVGGTAEVSERDRVEVLSVVPGPVPPAGPDVAPSGPAATVSGSPAATPSASR